jgi:hypothetical protein
VTSQIWERIRKEVGEVGVWARAEVGHTVSLRLQHRFSLHDTHPMSSSALREIQFFSSKKHVMSCCTSLPAGQWGPLGGRQPRHTPAPAGGLPSAVWLGQARPGPAAERRGEFLSRYSLLHTEKQARRCRVNWSSSCSLGALNIASQA